MPSPTKQWQISPEITPEARQALASFPPILQKLLFTRGYTDHQSALAYLLAEPPFNTNPFGLSGIPAAVDRIRFAIDHGESIAIYGDYDADGVTATALLTSFLTHLGANVQPYIPNRFEEGYGLNNDALKYLAEKEVDLVITVDCGIRSPEEAQYARQLGLDLIISDHHHPGTELPDAIALINPKLTGDDYPEKNLAGVGLAYKLASAMGGQEHSAAIEACLDLVAIGTVADMVPLTGENRFLVKRGIERLRQTDRQGLVSLIGVSGLQLKNLSATDIGFILGPRLNAAGRLDSALNALDLLLTQDLFQAGRLAQLLDIQNRERQLLTQHIQEDAELRALKAEPEPWLLFASSPSYNAGVVGLAASRLADRYYRPAIVAHEGDESTRGSCRSIPEFHITQALDECSDLLEHHGGHAAAAGFTIRNKNVSEFIDRLKIIASEKLSGLDLQPVLKADAVLPLEDLKPELLRYLDSLQPTGIGNPQAAFVSRDLRVRSSRTVGKENAHLKLTVTDGKITYDGIAFRQGHWIDQLPERIDLLYSFEANEFNGRTSLQLNIRDIKSAR